VNDSGGGGQEDEIGIFNSRRGDRSISWSRSGGEPRTPELKKTRAECDGLETLGKKQRRDQNTEKNEVATRRKVKKVEKKLTRRSYFVLGERSSGAIPE